MSNFNSTGSWIEVHRIRFSDLRIFEVEKKKKNLKGATKEEKKRVDLSWVIRF